MNLIDDEPEIETKEQRNARVRRRWDELAKRSRHGHYETLFALVREEIQLALGEAADIADSYGEATVRDAIRKRISAT